MQKSLQRARKLPRGYSRSLVSLSSFLSHHGLLLHHHQPCNSRSRSRSASLNPNAFYSQFHMDKNPQEEMKEDQSKLVSDSILPHILNLYSRATPKDFEIYAPNATFEDPLMCARGVKQIKSAFYSLAKVFSESRIVDYTITEKETSPGKTEILIDNKQYYKFLGKNIDMISLIKLYTEDGKVVRHEDRDAYIVCDTSKLSSEIFFVTGGTRSPYWIEKRLRCRSWATSSRRHVERPCWQLMLL